MFYTFTYLTVESVDSSSGGSWAWDTGTLSDDVIDSCQGVFIYRLERPVSSDAATYDWNTPLSVSSVSFRIFKRSDRRTTLVTNTQTTTTTSLAPATTENRDTSTSDSSKADSTTTSQQASSPTDTSTTDTASTTETGSLSSATATNTPPAPDSGLSVGAKASSLYYITTSPRIIV
jgi:hypothetical protein